MINNLAEEFGIDKSVLHKIEVAFNSILTLIPDDVTAETLFEDDDKFIDLYDMIAALKKEFTNISDLSYA